MTIKILGSEVEYPARLAAFGAHAEGVGSIASGSNAHAEGTGGVASGVGSHAENGTASGQYSHSEGVSTASAQNSHAENQSTAASNYSSSGGYSGRADAWSAWARGGPIYNLSFGIRAQVAIYTLGITTATTAATSLYFDSNNAVNGSSATANTLNIPTYSTYLFELSLVARRVGATALSHGFLYAGVAARDSGSVRLVSGAANMLGNWNDGTSLATLSFVPQAAYIDFKVTPSAAANTTFLGTLKVSELSVNS